MDMLQSLNKNQKQAVMQTEGYLRVIAGAGSGKTRLLVSRYAYIVKACGINTANILCITFTNKAAAEMRKRIKQIIGDSYDTTLICTYHAFCVRVLRENADKIMFPKGFQILDTNQQKEILGDIYQRRELKLDHGSFEKILKDITDYKAHNKQYVEQLCSTQNTENVAVSNDISIVEEYLMRQKQIYGLDFNDLLHFTLYLFKKHPDVCKYWQEKLNYIQVDEFQDSSVTEMRLIDVLSAKHKNLMIVGDPDQNIYEWRGSKVELLVNFDKSHNPTQTIYLNQNYRSTPQILHCANNLIEKNQLRLKKDLFTNAPNGAIISNYHLKNEIAEAEKIVELINTLRKEKNYKYSDFAILYRSGYLSRVVEKKFGEHGVPYEIYGGVKFFQRMEIQDIMAYLRLVAFDDDSSFKRIVNTPRRRFGRNKMQYLLSLQKNDSLLNTLKDNIDDAVFKNSNVAEFVDLIFELRQLSVESTLADIVGQICKKTGYENYIRELGNMERFDNLAEFQRIAYEYEKSFGENVSLVEFVNNLSLQAETLDDEENDMVKLMTIHSSKGLEFPCVFIIGLSEGIFPSAKTIEERKNLGLEEERRLCYVAITRAREQLFLFDSEGFLQNGKQKRPSRFLQDIGEHNYVRFGAIPKELQALPSNTANDDNGQDSTRTGDVILHPIFGKGKVLSLNKNKTSAQVSFENLSSPRDMSVDYLLSLKTNKGVLNIPVSAEPILPLDEKPNNIPIVQNNPPKLPDKPSSPKPIPSMVPTPDLQKPTIAHDDSFDAQPPTEAKPKNPNITTMFDDESFPKSGWICTSISDLGSACFVCQLCKRHAIRYVHHMYNPAFGSLDVGCVCAGKLEGSQENAKRREREYKSQQSRKVTFVNTKWSTSRNGNPYKKIDEHIVVLYCHNGSWKYSIDGKFCNDSFSSKTLCASEAFDAVNKMQ